MTNSITAVLNITNIKSYGNPNQTGDSRQAWLGFLYELLERF